MRELLAKLAVVEGLDPLSREAQRNATLLFFAHARATLASKRVLREHRLSAEALDYVIGEIEARFHKARTGRAAAHVILQKHLLLGQRGKCGAHPCLDLSAFQAVTVIRPCQCWSQPV